MTLPEIVALQDLRDTVKTMHEENRQDNKLHEQFRNETYRQLAVIEEKLTSTLPLTARVTALELVHAEGVGRGRVINSLIGFVSGIAGAAIEYIAAHSAKHHP